MGLTDRKLSGGVAAVVLVEEERLSHRQLLKIDDVIGDFNEPDLLGHFDDAQSGKVLLPRI